MSKSYGLDTHLCQIDIRQRYFSDIIFCLRELKYYNNLSMSYLQYICQKEILNTDWNINLYETLNIGY